MARSAVWVAVLLGVSTLVIPGVAGGWVLGEGVNGGAGCVACTFGLALVEQMSEMRNQTVVQVMGDVCSWLPVPQLKAVCRRYLDMAGPLLMQLLMVDPSPDTLCQMLGQCNTNPRLPVCRAVPRPPARARRSARSQRAFEERGKRSRERLARGVAQLNMGLNICEMEGVKEICHTLRNSFGHLVPVSDTDHDFFSTSPTLRGSAWRGKDCDDHDPTIHPGRNPINDDATVDSNCNGIFGVNPKSGVAYERELCGDTAPRGVAVLGDSISANFHIPLAWLDPTRFSEAGLKHWRFLLENEVNWPHMSSITGLGINHWREAIEGPIDSIYLRLRERNRCNHKDYQNIAFNGARASTMAKYYMYTLQRNMALHKPLVVFYAMLGMDVCNPYADDTFAYMTTPAKMRQKVLETLNYMDGILPANSTVFLLGLVDGSVLYKALHDRVHPIARHWKTFTYSQFYDFFNCLQVTSCAGWMNSNATVRNMTAQRANELSAVLREIAQQRGKAYTNLDVFYMDYPLNKALALWESEGGEAWQLLDPVDGFHPNQHGQALAARVMWEEAESISPGVFGPLNPNNQRIQQLFGQQGDYF